MKLLYTLGFLALTAGIMFIGKKIQGTAIRQIRKQNVSSVKATFLGIAILILFFLQYSLLTKQVFPYLLVLILGGAMIVALVVNEMAGAVLGVSLKSIRQKINVLYLAMSFQQGLNQPVKAIVMMFASLFLFAGWIGALIVFWRHPIGSPDAYVWIAICIFIAPQVTTIINSLNNSAPLIASEYIDDDLRNASLSGYFSSIIYSVIIFIFPFFLLSDEFARQFPWLPPFWVLLAIPLALFIFFGVIPFFIGTYAFRNQKKFFLEWQNNWLLEFRDAVKFSDVQKTEEKMTELDDEISSQVSENKMHAFLTGLESTPVDELEDNNEGTIFLILKDNIKNLRKWDLRLWSIDQLTLLKEGIGTKSNPVKLKEYINGELEERKSELARLNKGSNKAIGIITSLFIALIGFLLKTFQTDIINFLKNLN